MVKIILNGETKYWERFEAIKKYQDLLDETLIDSFIDEDKNLLKYNFILTTLYLGCVEIDADNFNYKAR